MQIRVISASGSRCDFAGFDDGVPVVRGSVGVFHDVVPVVQLLAVAVPTKLHL